MLREPLLIGPVGAGEQADMGTPCRVRCEHFAGKQEEGPGY